MGISTKDFTFSGIFNSTVYFGDHEKVKDLGVTSYSRIAAFVIDIFKRLGLSEGTVEIQVIDEENKRSSFTLILSQKEFNSWKNQFIKGHEHLNKDNKWKTLFNITLINKNLQKPTTISFTHDEKPSSWNKYATICTIIGAKNHAIKTLLK